MGTFTMELNEVLELTTDIGLNDYPIFKDEYRPVLNRKIIRHFFNQEIGQETISMFRLAMSRLMDEIMPYYNELYKYGLLEADPLSTVNVSNMTVSETVSNAKSGVETESDSNAKSRSVASDYPQQQLQTDSDYASSAQDNISGTTGTSSSAEDREDSSTGKVENVTKGYNGHAPLLIRAAREALINVDVMILNEIDRAGLFMLITSIPDDFTNRSSFYARY